MLHLAKDFAHDVLKSSRCGEKTHTIFRWCWLEVVGPNWKSERLMHRNLLFSRSPSWRSNLINYPPMAFQQIVKPCNFEKSFFSWKLLTRVFFVLYVLGWWVATCTINQIIDLLIFYSIHSIHPNTFWGGIYQPPANAAGLCWAWDCKQHGQKHHQKQQQQQQHHSLHCQAAWREAPPKATATAATTNSSNNNSYNNNSNNNNNSSNNNNSNNNNNKKNNKNKNNSNSNKSSQQQRQQQEANSSQLTANKNSSTGEDPGGIEPETFWMWGGRGACACGGGGGGVILGEVKARAQRHYQL